MTHVLNLSDEQLEEALAAALRPKSQKVAMIVLRAVKEFDEADEPRINEALDRLARRPDVGHEGDLSRWQQAEMWHL
jgi:hypothetical protein